MLVKLIDSDVKGVFVDPAYVEFIQYDSAENVMFMGMACTMAVKCCITYEGADMDNLTKLLSAMYVNTKQV